MYAIINDGGRQHSVQVGDVVDLDLRTVEQGETIQFDSIMLFRDGDDVRIGTPLVDAVTVQAEVVIPLLAGTKMKVQKFRRRKDSKKARGHRQKYTRVRITAINSGKEK